MSETFRDVEPLKHEAIGAFVAEGAVPNKQAIVIQDHFSGITADYEAALALLSWLASATGREGFVLVPREPTQKMLDVILEAVKDGITINDDAHRSIRHGYRAMLSAAPQAHDTEGGK